MTINSSNTEIPLYQKYPSLKSIPKLSLAEYPTPVQRMKNVEKILGLSNLWIKRDDLCSKKYGGNKPRKYEFILADALAKNKKHLMTFGGIGSNHVLANTIYAKDLGMTSTIYLIDQPLTEHCRRNILCDLHYGANIHYTGGYVKTFLKALGHLISDRQSYLIMPGASNALGTIGFVNAGLELAEQVQKGEMPEPDVLFVAVGSTGTCAGITLGLELAGLKTKVHGVMVAMEMTSNQKSVVSLAKKTLKLLRKAAPDIPNVADKIQDRVTVDKNFFGGEYGRVTQEGLDAIEIAKKDGIQLETTYTGKTFASLIAYAREHPNEASKQTILFWNTYNSVDLTPVFCDEDYHNLPSNMHKFFDNTMSLDDKPGYC